MSALRRSTDSSRTSRHVRFVPEPDIPVGLPAHSELGRRPPDRGTRFWIGCRHGPRTREAHAVQLFKTARVHRTSWWRCGYVAARGAGAAGPARAAHRGDFPENAPEARAVVAAFREELQ